MYLAYAYLKYLNIKVFNVIKDTLRFCIFRCTAMIHQLVQELTVNHIYQIPMR